jgi:uncharacterized membrane protein YjgN (DUF898 family)
MSIEYAPAAPMSSEPPAKGDFHGEGGALFLLWLGNAALTVLTLGIYFAWGKARVYKFIYGNTEFAGSRFRFTGNGKEIFIGTLKAMAILALLYAILFGGQFLARAAGMAPLIFVSSLVFFAALLFLTQIAIYSALAYRASRARFREIDFRLQGSPLAFAREAMPRLLLGLVTLGLAFPFYTHWKIGRIYGNLRFGNLAFAWRPDAKAYWILALKGYFFSLLTLGVYYFFWMPKRFAFILDHLSLGESRFRGAIRPGEFFALVVTNVLILFCTLGFGAAWVLTRTLRFFVSRVELENPSRLEEALQVGRAKAGVAGEALGNALDLGVGLGF